MKLINKPDQALAGSNHEGLHSFLGTKYESTVTKATVLFSVRIYVS